MKPLNIFVIIPIATEEKSRLKKRGFMNNYSIFKFKDWTFEISPAQRSKGLNALSDPHNVPESWEVLGFATKTNKTFSGALCRKGSRLFVVRGAKISLIPGKPRLITAGKLVTIPLKIAQDVYDLIPKPRQTAIRRLIYKQWRTGGDC
jgi:hypothetical protein